MDSQRRRRQLHHPLPTIAHGDGFTITEVLISMAMVSFLLIGISRIFALTSQTIGTGQTLSKSMRSLRAIQQTISADFLGSGSNIVAPEYGSGMMPLRNGSSPDQAAPFLTISNFRIAAYRNEAAARADTDAPADTVTDFATRSRMIRGIDLNSDGTEDTTTVIPAGGELTPLYAYGERNFRCDTVSFFVSGKLVSQTGEGDTYQSGARSNHGWVWYGHLRVFNGNAQRTNYSNAYGMPGDLSTPGPNTTAVDAAGPNRNNRYAEQFTLGRYQMLLIEPTDHDGDPSTVPTVVANNDPSSLLLFANRSWSSPTDLTSTTATPFTLGSGGGSVSKFNPNVSPKRNQQVDARDTPGGSVAPMLTTLQSRVDVAGTGLEMMRRRIRALEEHNRTTLPQPGDGGYPSGTRFWWELLPIGWSERFYVNPFGRVQPTTTDPNPPPFDARSMSQRQQLLAEGCTQFMVEYAGDFVTQDAVGNVTSATVPDGEIDFVFTPASPPRPSSKQVRWYGMPRDINGDGVIRGNTAAAPAAVPAIVQSPDVIPLRDFCGARQSFERYVPVPSTDYGRVPNEANNTTNIPRNTSAGPEDTAYICVWGTNEAETPVPYTRGGVDYVGYRIPMLVRIVLEMSDPDGKLKEPVRQEYTFPVPSVR